MGSKGVQGAISARAGQPAKLVMAIWCTISAMSLIQILPQGLNHVNGHLADMEDYSLPRAAKSSYDELA
jgi:hypothetical protein